MTTIELKDDQAALVFGAEGVENYIPDLDDDDIVPHHIYVAVALLFLVTKQYEKLEPLLNDVMKEAADDDQEEKKIGT